jgi:hypothetical protein
MNNEDDPCYDEDQVDEISELLFSPGKRNLSKSDHLV